MAPQWYRWQFEQDRRGDPPYGVLAKSSGGEYTPGDFMWLPIAAGIQSPSRETVGTGDPGPAYREQIAKAKEEIRRARQLDALNEAWETKVFSSMDVSEIMAIAAGVKDVSECYFEE